MKFGTRILSTWIPFSWGSSVSPRQWCTTNPPERVLVRGTNRVVSGTFSTTLDPDRGNVTRPRNSTFREDSTFGKGFAVTKYY